jgi:hypothetical protein
MPPLNNSISNIPVENFTDYIVEKLRRANPHMDLAFDESQYVLSGSVVHIPQAGNSPGVTKNRNTFPSVAVQRGDSSVTYALDVYSTDPLHVTWHEGAEISYDKMDSILSDITQTLVETIGDNMLYNWVHGIKKSGGAYTNDVIPSTNFIFTSGSATAVNTEDGQSGTRKSCVAKELDLAQAKMNKNNVPKEDRYAMLESYMYKQFVDSLSSNQMAAFQRAADLEKGIVGMYAGFKILERSYVLAFKSDNTPYLPGEVLDTDANLASLCWQKNCVTKSTGDIVYFQDEGSPQYYGDVMSALVKMGGRARREDWNGIIPIVQTL